MAIIVEAGRDVPWTIAPKPLFTESFAVLLRANPRLKDKLAQFTAAKLPDPLQQRFGSHDRPFTGPLKGFQHCHLAPDIILVYSLKGRVINLLFCCQHADTEGKRMKATAKKLAAYA
jgi:mRNA-degrading endonuclease YafQ of YafQ-DinJ toxin-antitoxin module